MAVVSGRWLLVAMAVIVVFSANVLEITSAQVSSLFQCQPSSDQSGLVYTPNIPDFYFNHEIVSFNYSTSEVIASMRETFYIFTIPSESHDCSGTVRSIQYCYRARDSDIDDLVNVFNFLVLSQDGLQFTVQNSTTIQTTPQDSICTDPLGDIEQICCDNTSLSTDLQISNSSDFTFGVVVINNDVRPLAFTPSATQFNVEQYQQVLGTTLPPPGTMFTVGGKLTGRSLLLLRFLIEPATTEMETSTTEMETSTTEMEPATTEMEPTTIEMELADTETTSTETQSQLGLTTPSVTPIITEANAVVGISIGALVGGVIGGGVAIMLITILLTTVCILMIMKLKQNLSLKEPTDAFPKEDMTLQGNAAYISTSPISLTTNEAYATTASTVPDHTHNSDQLYASIDGGGVTLDVEMQGNEAYSTSRPIPVEHNEAYATTVNPQSYLEEEDYI